MGAVETGMKRIYDCNGKLACMVDAQTGCVEREYKKSKTRSYLDVGRSIEFECQGARTCVSRNINGRFSVLSEVL